MRLTFNALFFFCAWIPMGIHAQNAHWQSIYQGAWTPSPHMYYINAMYEDTVDNLLYVGGGGSASAGILVYNGDSVRVQGTYPMGRACSFVRFNDTIYVGGSSSGKYFSKWNGSFWDTTGIEADGPVYCLSVINGELYAGGRFTSIAGISSYGLAKYDGSAWTDVAGFPFDQFIWVSAITEYNGDIYIGGSFSDSTGNVMNIARWDGQQWYDVGGGFHGGMDEVWTFEIYNNELYICGAFSMNNGNVGNYMAKWDGTTLSDVGGGTMGMFNSNGQVFDMAVWNNSLFAVGVFEFAGGIFTSYIAKWDGVNWCYLGDSLNGPVQCVATLDTSLYIGGGWWMIGSDTISGFARWTGGNYTANCGNTTGETESPYNNVDFIFYPNPINGAGTVEAIGTRESFILVIFDQLGREALRKMSFGTRVDFSTEGIAPGMYYYTIIQDDAVQKNGKIVIQ